MCELTADGSICKASVNTDDSIWGTALTVKLLVKLLGSLNGAAQAAWMGIRYCENLYNLLVLCGVKLQ